MLGLEPTASLEQIHQAFRRLAKIWHPDRFAAAPTAARARAERRMRALNRAYSTLGEPARRRQYDLRRLGMAAPSSPGTFAGDGWNAGGEPAATAAHEDTFSSALANRNGAGIFVGVLCLILAIGIFGDTMTTGGPAGLGGIVALAFAVALTAVALVCFTDGSVLADAAQRWAEGEPAGYADALRATRQAGAGSSSEYADLQSERRERDSTGQDAADPNGEREAFGRLVDDALETVPGAFLPFLANIVVRVVDEPTPDELARLEVGPGGILFGLFEGVPLTGHGAVGAPAEVITIYRGPITRFCHDDADRIREQVRRTVLHEVAHHFGIGHDQMPDWVR